MICIFHVIFFKNFDTALIKYSMKYCPNTIECLLYLFQENWILLKFFLDISGTFFTISFMSLRIFLVPCFLIYHNWHSTFHSFLDIYILFYGLFVLVISPYNYLYFFFSFLATTDIFCIVESRSVFSAHLIISLALLLNWTFV